MNLCGRLLEMLGWNVQITAPHRDRCVICVAPHTSNYDFILGLLAYKSMGRDANFLMKESWFVFPLKYIFRALGGIPVSRRYNSDLTSTLAEDFSKRRYMNLAVTPEGTRAGKNAWHTGFLRIARQAGVPIQLGIIDYINKRIIIKDEFYPTGEVESDLMRVKEYYRDYGNCAKYPDKFILDS